MPEDLPHNYGVLGVRVHLIADTLVVDHVHLHGPAHSAGVRQGDRLLAVLPYRMRRPENLNRYIKSLLPGTEIQLLISRQGEPHTLTARITDVRHLYSLMGEQAREPGASRERHQKWRTNQDNLEKRARSLIDDQKVLKEFSHIQKAFLLETDRYASDCRLQDVHFGLVNPLKSSQIATDLAADFTTARLDDHLHSISSHLDLTPISRADEITEIPDGLLPTSVLESPLAEDLFLPFVRSGLEAQRAFAALDASQKRKLIAGIPRLLEQLSENFLLDETDSTEAASHIQTLRLAKRVDLDPLLTAAVQLASLVQPATLEKIRHRARKLSASSTQLPPAFQGSFLFAAQTAWGFFLIGDDGPNFYGQDAALIVDLGGDDTYLNNCGAPILLSTVADTLPFKSQAPAGLLIDIEGDDRYIGNAWGTLGTGVGGVGLLADLEGDDLYQGDRLTQGAAFCGIGLLWDRQGHDTYLAQEFAQATAFFGAGILLDEHGHDFYSSVQFSQAFGGSRGFGLLYDREGNDRYLADRKIPSSYGTEGIFNGWSQGVGCGFRRFSSGGIGLLLDRAGDDDYQAGNFSQGLGYFFGLGTLVDLSGDDTYRGTRYSQGAAAHQAIGVLLDSGGDDRYQSQIAANQGGAWDAGIGILEDRGGDDHYAAEHLSQGAAAMNGFGVLFDWNGRDHYHALTGQAEGGSTSYWGGRGALNLGILIDLGGDPDVYNLAKRRDSTTFKGSGIGLFSDR